MIANKEIIAKLAHFGFDETDSLVYLGLVQTGEITVSNLASKLRIDRAKVYRTLNKLRSIGAITTTFTNPVLCKAEDPKIAFSNIIQQKEDEVIMLHKLAKDITRDLKNYKGYEGISEQPSFSIIQGRVNIYGKIIKIIQEARDTVYIMTSVEDLLRMYHTAIPDKIKEKTKTGIEIRLTTGMPNEKEMQILNKFNASEIKLGRLPSKGRIILEHGKQVIMSGSITDTMSLNDEMDSVMFTNSYEIVSNIYSLCSHIWETAEPVIVSR